jgi:hypothetical protein
MCPSEMQLATTRRSARRCHKHTHNSNINITDRVSSSTAAAAAAAAATATTKDARHWRQEPADGAEWRWAQPTAEYAAYRL